MAQNKVAASVGTTLKLRKRNLDDHAHPVNIVHHDEASFGEKLADRIATGIGSWTFLIVQTFLVAVWVTLNLAGWFVFKWDAFPFILLNLMFSVQAAYTGPVLLLAGNRQSQKDRLTLEHAADESQQTEERTQTILAEIRNNTDLTLQILKHLEASAASLASSQARIADAHDEMVRKGLEPTAT